MACEIPADMVHDYAVMKTLLAACAALVIVLAIVVSAQSAGAGRPAGHCVGLPDGHPRVPAGAHEGGRHAAHAGEVRRHPGARRPSSRRPASASCRSTRCRPRTSLRWPNSTVEAGQPELADDDASQKALDAHRADAAEPGEDAGDARCVSTMRQPVSEARNARAEKLVDQVEALPASFVRERIEAHGALNGYYRADDIDAGIIKHSTRLIELNKALTPEQRVPPSANMLIAAYENLAEALAGQEQNDKALDVLRRAPAELAGVAGVAERIQPVLERYQLVGTPGAAIEAPTWLNAPGRHDEDRHEGLGHLAAVHRALVRAVPRELPGGGPPAPEVRRRRASASSWPRSSTGTSRAGGIWRRPRNSRRSPSTSRSTASPRRSRWPTTSRRSTENGKTVRR